MMALVHPLGFGACRPEHLQLRLPGQAAKEEKSPAASRSCISTTLPLGFPLFVDSQLAWSTSDIQIELEHTYHLTREDTAEIDNALDYFKGLDLPRII